MRIDRLQIWNLRVLSEVQLRLFPGLNFLVGANGAGKTSVLEAVHLLSYGRSFRAGGRDALIRRGAEAARVFAELCDDSGIRTRLGIERSGQSWRGRVDDSDVAQLPELFRRCAVGCFEPGSHELISGTAELRRGLLDWGVFHVEPDFLQAWRRYQRALKQRNSLIRDQAPDDWFPPWEREMAEAAVVVDRMRQEYARVLAAAVQQTCSQLLQEFSGTRFELASGWRTDPPPDTESALTRLAEERGRDRLRGFSRRGPHRADWSLAFDQIPRREHLSRGQEKLCALAMVLAQLECLQQLSGDWPILLLDDLGSELDAEHQARVLDWLQRRPLQVLISGVELPAALGERPSSVFHVEQGRVGAIAGIL